MQRGIGRTGYLLLAFVLFALGAFGLVLGTIAFRAGLGLFYYIGMGTTAVALLALYAFACLTPLGDLGVSLKRWAKPQTQADAPSAEAPPAPAAAVAAPAAPMQTFEYDQVDAMPPATPVDMVGASESTPATPATQAPEHVTFQAAQPPSSTSSQAPASRSPGPSVQPAMSKEWPQRRKPVPRPGEAPAPEAGPAVRPELTERYTRATPTVRRMLDAETPDEKPQEHVADRAPTDMNTDFVAPGMSVGRCGQCKCMLLAPDTRPIRLKCPDCAKVTLLE